MAAGGITVVFKLVAMGGSLVTGSVAVSVAVLSEVEVEVRVSTPALATPTTDIVDIREEAGLCLAAEETSVVDGFSGGLIDSECGVVECIALSVVDVLAAFDNDKVAVARVVVLERLAGELVDSVAGDAGESVVKDAVEESVVVVISNGRALVDDAAEVDASGSEVGYDVDDEEELGTEVDDDDDDEKDVDVGDEGVELDVGWLVEDELVVLVSVAELDTSRDSDDTVELSSRVLVVDGVLVSVLEICKDELVTMLEDVEDVEGVYDVDDAVESADVEVDQVGEVFEVVVELVSTVLLVVVTKVDVVIAVVLLDDDVLVDTVIVEHASFNKPKASSLYGLPPILLLFPLARSHNDRPPKCLLEPYLEIKPFSCSGVRYPDS